MEIELSKYFGYSEFRDDQKEIIDHLLKKKNALVIKPTGFGKSILYQLPAMILPGLTLVISPLIALMKDQVDSLRSKNIDAAFINSSLNKNDRNKHYKKLAEGKYKILFVTPERFRKSEFLDALKNCRISLLAVDEAHCISEWGHDFRPDYTRLKEFRKITEFPPVIALTATATPRVEQDIVSQLGFKEEEIKVFKKGIDRPNLHLYVKHLTGEDNKLKLILEIIKKNPGSGIVYFTLIKDLKYMSTLLHKKRIKHLIYHGDLRPDERKRVQNQFMKGVNQLVLATNAFGMGIDKENIRFIIHAQIPGSIESYYQEIGRSGRDNLDSECLLLYDEDDLAIHMDFIKWSNPSVEVYKRAYDLLKNNSDKVMNEGIEYFREALSYRYGKDFTADTVIALFDRYGVIEGTFERSNVTVTSQLPDFFQNQELLDRKLKNEQEKLLKMLQYTKETNNHKDYINNYFS